MGAAERQVDKLLQQQFQRKFERHGDQELALGLRCSRCRSAPLPKPLRLDAFPPAAAQWALA
jgi:hypothetical protein